MFTIAFVLLALWLLGLVTGYAMGGFIHLLLAVAIILMLLQLFSRRKPA